MPSVELLEAQLVAARLEKKLKDEKERLEAEQAARRADLLEKLGKTSDPATVEALANELVANDRPVQVNDELRQEVREARRVFRQHRAAENQPAEDGDAVVRPETVTATATTNEATTDGGGN